MKNAILLHGRPGKEEYYDPKLPSSSNYQWFPWLQKQLIVNGIKADTPEVPQAFDPQWDLWVKEIERFELTPETMLVGHSCGGGFWVRYLSEHPELKVDTVVLVAPWINSQHEDDINFFDFDIDPDIVKRATKFVIFSSDNDHEDVKKSIEVLAQKLPSIKIRDFHKMGHFTIEDMKTVEFPELLAELL